jgi:hypothetical protein
LAGLLAVAGLAAAEQGQVRRTAANVFAPLLNWQLMAATVTALTGIDGLISQLTSAQLAIFGLPVAALAAVSALAFELRLIRRTCPDEEIVSVHQQMLVGLSLFLLGAVAMSPMHRFWAVADLVWAAIACLAIAANAFTSAVRTQDADRVWTGQAMLAASALYFIAIGAVDWTNPHLMYIVLFAGLFQWWLGSVSARFERMKILEDPCRVLSTRRDRPAGLVAPVGHLL